MCFRGDSFYGEGFRDLKNKTMADKFMYIPNDE